MEQKLIILIVEDERVISDGLVYLLRSEGFDTLVCGDFDSGRTTIETKAFDLALLDLNLPGGSGYQLARLIKEKSNKPIIMLTALDSEANVVMGLDQGADDYITKPFRVRELLSRIYSVLRRYRPGETKTNRLKLGDVEIDPSQAKVWKGEKEILLTSLEYRLLLIFMSEPRRVFTRVQLLERLWDCAGEFFNDNTLTVYIKRLREKIEDDPQHPILITTIRGLGYRGGGGD